MAVQETHHCVDCGREVEIKTFDEWRCINCETTRLAQAYLANPGAAKLSGILTEYLRISNELFIYTQVVLSIASAIKNKERRDTVAGFAERVCSQFGRVAESLVAADEDRDEEADES